MKLNNYVKFPLILGLTCLITGGSLALVNFVTEPIIREANAKKENKAVTDIFGEANVDVKNIKVIELDGKQDKAILAVKLVPLLDKTNGYYYTLKTPNGYKGPVTLGVGYKAGKIVGFSLINSEEDQRGADMISSKKPGDMAGIGADSSVKDLQTMLGSAGTTLTTTAIHKALMIGFEDIKTRFKDEPIIKTFKDLTLEAFPTLTNFEKLPIDKGTYFTEVAMGNYNDKVVTIYNVTSPKGFSGSFQYLLMMDGSKVANFHLVKSEENGLGNAWLENQETMDKLIGLEGATVEELITLLGTSGTTMTTDALQKSMGEVLAFEKARLTTLFNSLYPEVTDYVYEGKAGTYFKGYAKKIVDTKPVYIFNVYAPKGYIGGFNYLVACNDEGKVTKMKMISSSETALEHVGNDFLNDQASLDKIIGKGEMTVAELQTLLSSSGQTLTTTSLQLSLNEVLAFAKTLKGGK